MKKSFISGLTGALLLAVGGCYNYPAPPVATSVDTFTHREKDQADQLLAKIQTLSLAEAQRISLLNNPTYIAAHHSVSAALMRYRQALGEFSPVVAGNFSLSNNHSWITRDYQRGRHNPTGMRNNTFGTSTGIGATWLLFNGLAREFEVIARDHSHKYTQRMEEDYCRKLMEAVANAYNSVLLAIANHRIAKENSSFQGESLKYTRYKLEEGAVPLSDVLNFEILKNNADVDMISANYQYEAALYALAVLMGYPEGTLPAHIKFPTQFSETFAELPAVEIYLDTALANRPDLKGFREQLEIARYGMYQQYSAYSPTVNAFINFDFKTGRKHYSNYDWHIPHEDTETPSLSYGFTVDWTIFNGLIRYHRMKEFQAELAVADYNVAAQWFKVIGEVRTAYANYEQHVNMTRLYKKTRDISVRQRDLVYDQYRAGSVELTRLNEAQRNKVEAESQLASSYIAVENAKAQLDAAVGANTADFYLKNLKEVAPGLGVAPVKSAKTLEPKVTSKKTKSLVAQASEASAPTDPAKAKKATPAKKVTPAPAKKVTPAPAKKVTPAPAKKVTPAPVKKATQAPVIPTNATAAPAQK